MAVFIAPNLDRMEAPTRPTGIEGSTLPGPYPVGSYAAELKQRLREFANVQVFGEVWNLGGSKAKVYFELRDERGALPCSMWRTDFEKLKLDREALADGAQIVVGGGTDYYEGSRTSSPSFTFLVRDLRVAGEGDLLAQLARLRKQLDAEGLFDPQKRLPRPALPRTIGVVTWPDRQGARRRAGRAVAPRLAGAGWCGRSPRSRTGAPRPAITRALQDLAATGEVDTIVVARGGGSLADMFAFCDETLCRTVALLSVPVISSVGHHTDRTLIDDVSAVCCSTPTHAAEQAVRIHCDEARPPPGPLRRPPARRRPAHRGPPRPASGRADPCPGRAPGPRAPAPAPAAARAAGRGLAPHRRRAPRHPHPADGAGAQGRERRRGPTRSAAARAWSACAWRWPPTTPSAPSSAATPWSTAGRRAGDHRRRRARRGTGVRPLPRRSCPGQDQRTNERRTAATQLRIKKN